MAAILILDTCAVLDLIRAPVRKEFNVNYTGLARKILATAKQADGPLRLIVSDVVKAEYNRNLSYVLEDAERQLKKRCADYRHALGVVSGYSDIPESHCVDEKWIEENLKHGRRLAEDFLRTASIEVATNDDQLRGGNRVWNRVPPAAVGNNNLADCIITEIALRIAAANKTGAADAPKVVFFSSNTAEFLDVTHLKPSLQAEFDAAALKYVKSWGEAWAETLR